mmetsp:Transcript_13712/g.28893  ORF Transcript_13712/g.28893 Transcript_13712/m.28893 type:complete len:202 (-) Transcript_13712:14-619(-)
MTSQCHILGIAVAKSRTHAPTIPNKSYRVGRVFRALLISFFSALTSRSSSDSASSVPKASVSISVNTPCSRTDSCSWYRSDGGRIPSVWRLTMIWFCLRTMETMAVWSANTMRRVVSLLWLALHEFRAGVFCFPTRYKPSARRSGPVLIDVTGIAKRTVRWGSSSSSSSSSRPYCGTLSAVSPETTYHIASASRRDGRPPL